MALILCPECGEKISDKAKNCVHCGCKITVCPECGNATAGDVKTCSICGFVIEQEKREEKVGSKEKMDNAKNINKVFCKNSPIANVFSNKIANVINIVLIAAVLLFAGFAIIGFLVWVGNGDFLSAQDTINTTKTLLIIATITMIILYAYGQLSEYLYTLLFSRFLDENKIDSISAITESLNVDFDKMTLDAAGELSSDIRETINATVIQKSVVYKTQKTKNSIIKVFIFAIFAIFICAFLIDVASVWGGTVMLLGKNHFELSLIENWWLLVVAVIALVVGIIWGKIVESSETKAVDSWVKKNIPNQYKQYERKVKNFDDYIVDKVGEME